MEKKKSRRILKKLKNKYRLVILNDSTFEEKFSYRLSRLNILTLLTTFAVIIILIVSGIIVLTPLREFIPGYTDVNLRKDLTKMVIKSDSLERTLKQNNQYLNDLSLVLKGGIPHQIDSASLSSDEQEFELEKEESGLPKSRHDSMLREYVEREDAYSLFAQKENIDENNSQLYFFPPLKGEVTESFKPAEKHFGIDIVAPKDEAIKSALDGTVIFSEWTVETGYVIHIQHENNLVSIYKHNSVLLKHAGENVKAGEAIAIVGNSGELSTGPHLHFELWKDGSPLDPLEYINFN